MSDLAIHVDRLLDLAEAVCDESASLNDVAELDTILFADQRARYDYLDYCRLHVTLRLRLRARRAAQKVCHQINIKPVVSATDDCSVGRFAQSSATSPAPTFLSTTFNNTLAYFSDGMPLAYLLATVITGLGLLIGSLIPASHPEQVALVSSLVVEPTLVGRITGMVDCKIGDSRVSLGQKVDLASGLLEITYDTGAKVILQGPVAYSVEVNGGYLAVGKLTGKLEAGGGRRGMGDGAANHQIPNPKSEISNPQSLIPNPFVIRTPTATVIDLGTEFGVEVRHDGTTNTRVFAGEVQIATTDAYRSKREQTRVIRAGQFARVGRNDGLSVSEHPSEETARQFTRVMPAPKWSSADAYAELVLSMKPAVYYRMEQPRDEKDGNVVFDSAPGGHHGILHFSNEYVGTPYDSGRFGRSLRFRGPMVGDYAIVPDYPKATHGRLTVSAWVLAIGRPYWAMVAANWGNVYVGRYDQGQFMLGICQFPKERKLLAAVTQRDGRLACAEVHEEPFSEALPMGVWQHLALVADGTVLHVYRDGVQVAAIPCLGVLPNPPMTSLGIGCKTNTAGTGLQEDPVQRAYWQGRIDELAIFNQAFSAQEIRQLYLGKSLPGQTDSKHSQTDRRSVTEKR